jgi:hypothetical protein
MNTYLFNCKECEEEIDGYVRDKGYELNKVFTDISISRDYFYNSYKGNNKDLENLWNSDYIKMDKYLLEFIGHILRKYKITNVNIEEHGGVNEPLHQKVNLNTYISSDWKLENITIPPLLNKIKF